MFTRIRAHRAHRREQRQAARDLWTLDRSAIPILERLAVTANHRDRADLIRQLAEVEYRSGDLWAVAYGPDPEPDEDGRDPVTVYRDGARLLLMVADTETAIGWRRERDHGDSPLEQAAAPVLDQAVAAGTITLDTLSALADAVVDLVGPQAARVLAYLPVLGERYDYGIAG